MTTAIPTHDATCETTVASLIPALEELERALRFADTLIEEANDRMGLVPTVDTKRVVPMIQTKGKRTRCLAWFHPEHWSTQGGEMCQEINFCAEHLDRDPVDIVATVIHEKVHKWCHSLGIKDCAESGRHNKAFKSYAEYLGLEVAPATDGYGFGYTKPTPQLMKRIQTEFKPDALAFNLFRLTRSKNKQQSKNLRKWACGGSDCPTIYSRGARDVLGECHRCGESWEETE